MRSLEEFRATLAEGSPVAVIVGPLGQSDVLTEWFRGNAGGADVRVLTQPPASTAEFTHVIDLRTADRHFIHEWFEELYPNTPLARDLAPAAGLIDEALKAGISSPGDDRLAGLRDYSDVEADLHAVGGPRFFDFGRILALVSPRPIQIGDEWVRLVNRLGGSATWSIADLGIVLRDCGSAFAVGRDDEGNDIATFASPFIARIVANRVKASTSEHYALYRALRDMAVESLEREDAGNSFITSELPRQALLGDALDELSDDGLALLAAHPRTLIDVIETRVTESDPLESLATYASPGSRLVLRAAHRLDQADTLSQLELAARRSAMIRFADQIAAGTPPRPWGPVWATSQPVNTNRILLSESANVMCLALDRHDPEGTSYAGLSDGTIWEVSPYRPKRRAWVFDDHPSEVRAMVTVDDGGRTMLVCGHSDATIRWIDPVAGRTVHVYDDLDTPLSAVGVNGGVVAAGGVDGRLIVAEAVTGKLLYDPIELGSEIRGICILSTIIITCLVNGVVQAIDTKTGRRMWAPVIPGTDEVCNSVAAVEGSDGIRIAIGASSGKLFEASISDLDETPEFRHTQTFKSSINALLFSGDDQEELIAAYSDAWASRAPGSTKWQSYLGHVGAVNAVVVAESGRVLTGGGEGTVRTWLPQLIQSEAVVRDWGVRHQGPVSGINIDLSSSHGEVTHVTGGVDGTVRVWYGASDTTGNRIAEHGSPISALHWDVGTQTVYVGHKDGVLRTVARHGDKWEPQLIGIVHDGIRGLALSPDGRLYSTGVDGTVTRWHRNLAEGPAMEPEPVAKFGHISAIGWLKGAIVVGGQDGKLRLLNPITLKSVTEEVDLGPSIVDLATHEGDLFVALASGEVAILPNFEKLDIDPLTGLDAAGKAKAIERAYKKAQADVSLRGEIRKVHNGEVRGIAAFELGGNLVIATTGLDRKLVISDPRVNEPLMVVPQDGFGTGLHADPPFLAISTTSGAMVLRLSEELPGFSAAGKGSLGPDEPL